MLRTVFYPSSQDASGYIKATVRSENVGELIGLGWYLTQGEATKQAQKVTRAEEHREKRPEQYVENGDMGAGKPGTMEWHKVQIAQMEDKESVVDYVGQAGHTIDKRGSLDTVKEKALKALEGE
jgi:hypothetical protein